MSGKNCTVCHGSGYLDDDGAPLRRPIGFFPPRGGSKCANCNGSGWESAAKTMLSGGGPVTEDHRELKENGQQKGYVVLTPEERAKGFVRPVRTAYVHVGARPKHPTRELTEEEDKQYATNNYYLFEIYPESESPVTGKFWTLDELNSGCGTRTTMSQDIAETYARDPKFYGGTFCCQCRKHLPLNQFVWEGTDQQVGS